MAEKENQYLRFNDGQKMKLTIALVISIIAAFLFIWLIWQPQNLGSGQLASTANIIVDSPKTGDTVGPDFVVSGKARVFESQFSLQVIVPQFKNQIVFSTTTYANAPDVGQYGVFQVKVNLPASRLWAVDHILLKAFDYSAKDGAVIDEVDVPLILNRDNFPLVRVKVYFNNNHFEPEFFCNEVFGVERAAPKTLAIARTALQELLNGPTEQEKLLGYFSSIPSGVEINNLIIKDGTADVDFNDALDKNIGGSCRVAAIRAQITQTLKQFPTTKNIVISRNGDTKTVLQP